MKRTLGNMLSFWRFHFSTYSSLSVELEVEYAHEPSGELFEVGPFSRCKWDAMIANNAFSLRQAAARFLKLFPPIVIEGNIQTRGTATAQLSLYLKRAWVVTYRLLKEMLEVRSVAVHTAALVRRGD